MLISGVGVEAERGSSMFPHNPARTIETLPEEVHREM